MAKAPRYGEFTPDDRVDALAASVLGALWNAMLAESSAAISGNDADAIHDMRVAIRRLRSALRTFRQCYPKKRRRRVAKATKRLARQLGVVRDADVHLEALRDALSSAPAIEHAGIAFLMEQVGEQRGGALAKFEILMARFDRGALDRMVDGV